MSKKNKYYIVGNWKMNTDIVEAENLIEEISIGVENTEQEVVVCPPHVFLEQCYLVQSEMKDNKLKIGAQDISWEEKGSITGDISMPMIKNWVEYVIVGHSERRHYFVETGNVINKKLKLALKYKKAPILCVGEKKFTSSQDVTELGRELLDSIDGLTKDELKKVIVAYEPVWAIGTGNAADPGYVNRVIAGLRAWIKDEYDFALAEKIKILYGGSVNTKNAKDYLQMEHVDGLLIGGASLKTKSFVKIVADAGKIVQSL